jgi:5-methylcytosine-specific restriction endonuclease McrA
MAILSGASEISGLREFPFEQKVRMMAAMYGIKCPSYFHGQPLKAFVLELVPCIQEKIPGWNGRRLAKLMGKTKPKPVWKVIPHRPAKTKDQQRAPSQSKIDAFYKSWDWKRLRYDFIKDHERRCECCGATPNYGAAMVVDHIKPIRRYWHLRLVQTNLQMLCDDCNMGKGSRDETDWRMQTKTGNIVPFPNVAGE